MMADWHAGTTAGTWTRPDTNDIMARLRELLDTHDRVRNHTLDPLGGWDGMRMVPEITYDPKEKRFEVRLPWDSDHSVRYFKTKRSALRFVKRWEHRQDNPKPKKLKPSEARIKWQKLQQEDEDRYFERLGV